MWTVSRTLLTHLAALVFLNACTPKKPPPSEPPSLTWPKHPLSQIDESLPRFLLIESRNPANPTGPWDAKFERQTFDGAILNRWMIASSARDQNIRDRLANHAYLEHLVDGLRSLEIDDVPGPGTPQRFGLESPVWKFSWEISGQPYRLEIGISEIDSTGGSTRTFARVSTPHQTGIVNVRGPLLPILEHSRSFDYFREPVLLSLIGDDIQKVQSQGRQWVRLKSGWKNERSGKSDPGFERRLQDLLHLRIEHFVDSDLEHSAYAKKFAATRNRGIKWSFTDTQNHVVRAWFTTDRPPVAQTSQRPNVYFELYVPAIPIFSLSSSP